MHTLRLFICFRNNNSFKGKRKPLCKQCGNCTKCKTCKCNNEIIVEDHLFRFNPYKNYLQTINKQEEFKKIAHENFEKEIIKFGNSI